MHDMTSLTIKKALAGQKGRPGPGCLSPDIGVGNYLSATPSELGNYVSADSSDRRTASSRAERAAITELADQHDGRWPHSRGNQLKRRLALTAEHDK